MKLALLFLSIVFALTFVVVVKGVRPEQFISKKGEYNAECAKVLRANLVPCHQTHHKIQDQTNVELVAFHDEYVRKVQEYDSSCQGQPNKVCLDKLRELEDWTFGGLEKINDKFNTQYKTLDERCIKTLSEDICKHLKQ